MPVSPQTRLRFRVLFKSSNLVAVENEVPCRKPRLGVRHSRLSGGGFAFLCQCVEVATACVQHACAYQLFNDIEDAQPFFRLVARCLEEYMQVQAILPHCSEESQNTQGEWLHYAPHKVS